MSADLLTSSAAVQLLLTCELFTPSGGSVLPLFLYLPVREALPSAGPYRAWEEQPQARRYGSAQQEQTRTRRYGPGESTGDSSAGWADRAPVGQGAYVYV